MVWPGGTRYDKDGPLRERGRQDFGSLSRSLASDDLDLRRQVTRSLGSGYRVVVDGLQLLEQREIPSLALDIEKESWFSRGERERGEEREER